MSKLIFCFPVFLVRGINFYLGRFFIRVWGFWLGWKRFSQEFLTGMKTKVKEPEGMKMLKEAFKVFDSNGIGSVSRFIGKLFKSNNILKYDFLRYFSPGDRWEWLFSTPDPFHPSRWSPPWYNFFDSEIHHGTRFLKIFPGRTGRTSFLTVKSTVEQDF